MSVRLNSRRTMVAKPIQLLIAAVPADELQEHFLKRSLAVLRDQRVLVLERDELPMIDDADARAQQFDLFEVVRGQEDGHAAGVDALQERPELDAQFDV